MIKLPSVPTMLEFLHKHESLAAKTAVLSADSYRAIIRLIHPDAPRAPEGAAVAEGRGGGQDDASPPTQEGTAQADVRGRGSA